jgi:hypothetical protein
MKERLMRATLGLAIFAGLFALSTAAEAQYAPPRGSYQRYCRDIRMQGQFLSAWCQGSRGGGQSSINVMSCSTDIGVDPSGALVCGGPGGAPPPPAYGPPPPGPGYRPPPGPGYGRWSATLYEGRGFRGRSVVVTGDTPNLAYSGLNDRVGSIRFASRSGPWQVCSDANFRGNCATIGGDIADTGQLGMRNAISSLRPVR